MGIRIWPWKPGNQGYACMPMKKNVPNPKHEDWKQVQCPICGTDCWESDLTRQVKAAGVQAVCTECALTIC